MKMDSRDIHGFYGKFAPNLFLTVKEEELGKSELSKMGIPEGAPFICFHGRDSAYLNLINPSCNWHYHDYRDTNINNYILAARQLASRGYYLFRMGAVVKCALSNGNPRIIDYATKYRTDFLDIYLSAKCHFFIASGSGIDEVPKVFRRPVLYVNFIPLEHIHSWRPVILTIPKKLFSRGEKRFLTFREIINSGMGRFLRDEEYEKAGIDIVENTPEEIQSAALEMDDRLKGQWKETDEDRDLQERFWSLFKQGPLHGKINSRIGAEFLRQNKQLLE